MLNTDFEIFQLHIYDEKLQLHQIPKVRYWRGVWWLWRPLDYCELIVS